jgi:Flp pilus assembly protein CpaB
MKQKNLILMVVAVGCGLVAAFLTTQINARPRVEQVEVIVAAKDLAVGTMMTKADLPKLITRKKIAKDALPTAFVLNEDEMLDRRLTRPVLKDETFNPGILTKGGVITPPEGMDMISMPVTVSNAVAGFVGPGSKVDVLATLRTQNQLRAFPLLVDMLVLAVDQHVSYDTGKGGTGVFPNMNNVTFAATQEQALLLALAKQRGCHLELLLRHPGKPLEKAYDIKQIKKLLEDFRTGAEVYKTEDGRPIDDPSSELPVFPSTAPDPKPVVELIKVWTAKVNIEPGTEITKELVAQKLVETEIPKVLAKGAYSDLSELINKNLTLKTGLSEGQWVTSALVGPPSSKVPPLEAFQPPKANPEPPKSTGPRAIRDVTVTGPNGTLIHRFEEWRPGEWRLKAILTPQEAGRRSTAPQPAPVPAPKPEEPRNDKEVD